MDRAKCTNVIIKAKAIKTSQSTCKNVYINDKEGEVLVVLIQGGMKRDEGRAISKPFITKIAKPTHTLATFV